MRGLGKDLENIFHEVQPIITLPALKKIPEATVINYFTGQ